MGRQARPEAAESISTTLYFTQCGHATVARLAVFLKNKQWNLENSNKASTGHPRAYY